jgi:oligopeptide/dipeptide ABC transporter ATP-binding protein
VPRLTEPSALTDSIAPTDADHADGTAPHLTVTDLTVRFVSKVTTVFAVNGVSFSLLRGERVGIAGESGSGKSVTCRALLGLLPENAVLTGSALFSLSRGSYEAVGAPESELNEFRGSGVGYVFQDSRHALDPHLSVGEQLAGVAMVHGSSKAEARDSALAWLSRVGIEEPLRRYHAYPDEFSGGMCQRLGIAMALIAEPELVIADEPTSDVDVTTQARLIRLISDLCREQGVTLILVSHDLGVLSRLCDRVLVFYGGLIIESAPVDTLLSDPVHPYSRGLISSIPSVSQINLGQGGIPGHSRTVDSPLTSCPFFDRCSIRMPSCATRVPELLNVPSRVPPQLVRCPVVLGERNDG